MSLILNNDKYILGLSVCLFVSNKRQNGWTNRAWIFMGPYVTPGKVYVGLNFQKASNKIWFFIIWKSTKFVIKSENFCFTMYSKKTVNNFNRRWAQIAIKDSDAYSSKQCNLAPRAHVADIADFSYRWIFYIITCSKSLNL